MNVVRCFDDANVIHVAGRVDPVADIEVIQTELCLADLGTVDKSLQRYTKAAKSGNDKEAAKLVQVLTKLQAALNEAIPVRAVSLTQEEKALVKHFAKKKKAAEGAAAQKRTGETQDLQISMFATAAVRCRPCRRRLHLDRSSNRSLAWAAPSR